MNGIWISDYNPCQGRGCRCQIGFSWSNKVDSCLILSTAFSATKNRYNGVFFEHNSELERLDGSKIHRDDNRIFRLNPIG